MKKAVIIGFVFAIIAISVVFFFFLQAKEVKENRTLTKQLSPALLEQLQGKHISDFPYAPAPIQWEGKYLEADYDVIFEENHPPLYFSYNKKRNEKLNTARFFPGNDIKGMVWLTNGYKLVGRYRGGGNATQPYSVLSYLDLAQKTILAQDTIWGGMPPRTTNSHSGANGKAPKEEEIIKAIQSRTGISNVN
ncbi:MAG: hypothetical protein FWF52_06730 [Candidatus Azobacteroides sp.]|nr:hypothetical protein [Candidatus Azobacteroides sp.]